MANSGKKKIGYTVGTFDLLHIGHLNVLRRAKEKCDFLIVGINSDDTIRKVKKREPIIPFEERRSIIEALRYTDKTVKVECEKEGEKASDWSLRVAADIVFSGDDHKTSPDWVELEKVKKETEQGEVCFFPYTKENSSTKIRNKVAQGNH